MTAQESAQTTAPSTSTPASNSATDDDALIQRLEESGKLRQIQQDFTAKLVQCGWRDELKDVAKYSVRDCGGITEVTVDELVAQVVPHGEATVPQTIKEEMMEQIRQAVRQEQQR